MYMFIQETSSVFYIVVLQCASIFDICCLYHPLLTGISRITQEKYNFYHNYEYLEVEPGPVTMERAFEVRRKRNYFISLNWIDLYFIYHKIIITNIWNIKHSVQVKEKHLQ